MNKSHAFCLVFALLTVSNLIGLAPAHNAAWAEAPRHKKKDHDWPQWRGPNRDGISTETGYLKTWPDEGPKVLWKIPVGEGYSAMSISNGKLYTMAGTANQELVLCFDAATGEELWRFTSDPSLFKNSWGNGPRSTPTLDGSLVFTLGAKAKLHALKAESGERVWGHDLVREFGAKIPTWGVATSPLVNGDLLVVDVAGGKGYGLVAFDKKNGKVVWKSKTELAGYSAPISVSVDAIEQIIAFTGTAVISVSPKSGERYWHYEWRKSPDVNAATPIFIAPDRLFVSSGYNKGGAVLRITTSQNRPAVEEVWKSRIMRNHFGSSILSDGHLYGFDEGTLRCVEASSGESKWGKRGLGKGSLIMADGHLIVLSEKGKLVLVEATPSGFAETASAQVLDGRCWTVPTLANGKLYVRNRKEIVCLDVSGSEQL